LQETSHEVFRVSKVAHPLLMNSPFDITRRLFIDTTRRSANTLV
jgi:hypothetical protein